MAQIISASINLSKIDKSRIKKSDKGDSWYNLAIFINDEADKFGNTVQIKDNNTIEDKQVGRLPAFLGNGKITWTGTAGQKTESPKAPTNTPPVDDLPF